MNVFFLLLLLGGAVCFVLAMLGATLGRFSFLAAGLLCWILVPLITAFDKIA